MIMDSVPDAAFLALPAISGLEDKIKEPKPGQSYNIKELNNALELIRLKNENPLLRPYNLVRIDFSKGGRLHYLFWKGLLTPGLPGRRMPLGRW